MTYKDQHWNRRYQTMGDIAETVFQHVASEVLDRGCVRYGLDRPPLRIGMLPPFIRYTPDFLMSNTLVEVQGFGNDQLIKLKLDKYAALLTWDTIHPTNLFLWDSTNNRWAMLTIDEIQSSIADGEWEQDSFPEGKRYWKINADDLTDDWTDYET